MSSKSKKPKGPKQTSIKDMRLAMQNMATLIKELAKPSEPSDPTIRVINALREASDQLADLRLVGNDSLREIFCEAWIAQVDVILKLETRLVISAKEFN